jgi:NAD(P)-dependent dehydrogenase (short-subunit alcohol dehydrogenase family)
MTSLEVILVTGANTGLGFQIIRALCSSDRSYNILLAGRSLAKADEATKAATEEFPSSPSKIWPIQVDIEDDNSMQKAFEETRERFGRVDTLINNAGMLKWNPRPLKNTDGSKVSSSTNNSRRER